MSRPLGQLPDERRLVFRLTQTNDDLLDRVLDDTLRETMGDLVLTGQVYMPGETLFKDENLPSSSMRPRLVFVLELPTGATQPSEEKTLSSTDQEGPRERRCSIWCQASRSTKCSIRKALSHLSGSKPPQCGKCPSSAVAKLSPHTTLPLLSLSGVSAEAYSPQDHQRTELIIEKPDHRPFPANTSYQPVDSPMEHATINSLPFPEVKQPPLASAMKAPRPLPALATPESITPPPTCPPPPKRESSTIRGKNLPFPAAPATPKRRRSVPVLPNAGGRPRHCLGPRASSYSYTKERRGNTGSESGELLRGRSIRPRPLLASRVPIPAVSPTSTRKDKRKRTSVGREPRSSSLLHVSPRRVSQPKVRRLPPIPTSPLSAGSSPPLPDQTLSISTLTVVDRRRESKNTMSNRRPTPLSLVFDNTRLL